MSRHSTNNINRHIIMNNFEHIWVRHIFGIFWQWSILCDNNQVVLKNKYEQCVNYRDICAIPDIGVWLVIWSWCGQNGFCKKFSKWSLVVYRYGKIWWTFNTFIWTNCNYGKIFFIMRYDPNHACSSCKEAWKNMY